jgi:hypothetical protein
MKALELVPVRTEAQLLLSRHTFRREKQHKGELWSNPKIESAVRRALPWYQRRFCLAGQPKTGDYLRNEGLHDPIVWYASVLPEADGEKELEHTEHAIHYRTHL